MTQGPYWSRGVVPHAYATTLACYITTCFVYNTCITTWALSLQYRNTYPGIYTNKDYTYILYSRSLHIYSLIC